MLLIKASKVLVIILFCFALCSCFRFDKFYFSSVFNVTAFRKLLSVSLSRCVYECKIRSRCVAINYRLAGRFCSLIDGSDLLQLDVDTGFVSGRKSEWNMAHYDPCNVCLESEVCDLSSSGIATCKTEECGFPPVEKYTEILGNIYTVGASVCYRCQEGYVNVGGDVGCSTCSESGIWTVVTIQCEQPFTCDISWFEYDGHCYLENPTELKWEDAESYCLSQGGYLLSLESEHEAEYIKDVFRDGGFWLGGNDISTEGFWVWNSGNPITFTNWDDLEPSSTYSNSDCMRSRSDWRWHDMNCYSTYASICEKEPPSSHYRK